MAEAAVQCQKSSGPCHRLVFWAAQQHNTDGIYRGELPAAGRHPETEDLLGDDLGRDPAKARLEGALDQG